MRQLGGDGANTSLAATAFGGDMIKALHWGDAPPKTPTSIHQAENLIN